MESISTLFHLDALMAPGAAFLVALVLALSLRYFLLRHVAALADKTKTRLDDIVVYSIRTPSLLWCLMLSLYFGMRASDIPAGWSSFLEKGLAVLALLSVTLAAANISSKLIATYTAQADAPYRLSTFSRNLLSVIIFVTGGLFILSSLGISITPLLATLGVGGLAVALGLQETLANLFAGFYTIASKQVRVGDYIKLETGQEGYVADINWRTTKIRALPNNMILVPNAKLAQTIITNYYFPDKELAVLVEVGVHYDSDLKRVEKVTIETAAEIMKKTPGGVPNFQPFIRYHTFGDFSVSFTVILRAKEFVDQYLVKHEFIKALHERYRQEGIVIPYPIRAINNRQENMENPPPGNPQTPVYAR